MSNSSVHRGIIFTSKLISPKCQSQWQICQINRRKGRKWNNPRQLHFKLVSGLHGEICYQNHSSLTFWFAWPIMTRSKTISLDILLHTNIYGTDHQISEPFLLPFLFDQVYAPPANWQTPLHSAPLPLSQLPPLLHQLRLDARDAWDQLSRHMGQLCLLHIPLFHNVSDVDAGDGVDVDGGGAPLVVLHLVIGQLLLRLLLCLSVERIYRVFLLVGPLLKVPSMENLHMFVNLCVSRLTLIHLT